MEKILSLKNISKSFPGVKALEDVSIDFYKGEIHAIMGENGAGKSTLMKILFGLQKQDTGEIIYKGEAVSFSHVADALNRGIAMVHQELAVVPERSVAENIFLGKEPRYKNTPFINKSKMCADTAELFKSMEITGINPSARMKSLSIAQMQLVEIAKAYSYHSDVLILDEATSSITEKETENLFKLLNKMRNDGIAILYISHKMDEVFRISDRITVLRDGKTIGTKMASEMDSDGLIQMMVGREIKNVYPKVAAAQGKVLLEAKNFSRSEKNDDINLCVRSGEILGIGGLVGAGRSELVESFFGLRNDYSGDLYIHGEKVKIKSPQDAIKHKMALIPEDRRGTGLNLSASVKDNLTIVKLADFCKGGFVKRRAEKSAATEQVKALTIKTPSLNQKAGLLSGGNQQKVVLGKWLMKNCELIIMDEPTRGIDVGAKRDIYLLMNDLVAQGKAVIMISSEIPEIIGMCDRVVVMHEGEMTGELTAQDITQENIMRLAAGTKG